MKKDTITKSRERLLTAVPLFKNYISTFKSINKRWGSAITSGLIEVGRMETHASRLFTPLITDMDATKNKYTRIQEQLINAILFEMVKKVVLEVSDAAKFTINILKRNLFERTADVGYLATDAEIVDFLKSSDDMNERVGQIRERLAAYQYEYTVYNEIIILDTEGNVKANLDKKNHITHSSDHLISQTQDIDLHSNKYEEKYIETCRPSDLRPGKGDVLIYSQKIEDPESHSSLGTLCLCFDFEDEMKGIFKDLGEGNQNFIIAVLDETGRVMCSSRPDILDKACRIPVDLETDFRFLNVKGTSYLVSTVETDGYQGFYGLTWYGLVMTELETSLNRDEEENSMETSVTAELNHFSSELASIRDRSGILLDDMKLDSINGQVMAQKFAAKAFVEVLQFVKFIGEEINGLFSSAIGNLQQTIVSSLFNEVQFRAFQGNNIADRNLYERANDVCWWALTPLFRKLMAKHEERDLTEEEKKALTENLQYINDLYTPYLRLVFTDREGKVIALSNPPAELEERFTQDDMPAGQDFIGMTVEKDLAARIKSLNTGKDYCVSDFKKTPLYGGRPTYIYSTAVRHPENDSLPVGSIMIVFDSEPQFKNMLLDVLPRNDRRQVQEGCFGLFVTRDRLIISSTNPDYPEGSILELNDSVFSLKKGERSSAIIELNSNSYALGLQVSNGYREYKKTDGYSNDIICMIFVPI